MTNALQIAVVDNQPIYRQGIEYLLRSAPDYCLVAEGENLSQAVDISVNSKPDIMLIDLNIPGGGLNALRQIMSQNNAIKMVVLTDVNCETQFLETFKSGAKGFIAKAVEGQKLLRILKTIGTGGTYAEPSLASSCISHQFYGSNEKKRMLELLTNREQEILELVAEGKTNKEIAIFYKITERTVKYFMTNILQKLNVRNRVEAALVADKYRQKNEDFSFRLN